MKMCRRCLIEKDYSEFHKNKQIKDGYSAYCKTCKSNIDKQWVAADPIRKENRKSRSREWQKANPERYQDSIRSWRNKNPEQKWILDKKSHLWTHYRMTIDEFQKMFLEQDGKCLICEKQKKLVVDHDHSCCPGKLTCGKCTRGLICHSCNTLVGYLETHKNLLDKAASYLTE
jgi:hypothetical protein